MTEQSPIVLTEAEREFLASLQGYPRREAGITTPGTREAWAAVGSVGIGDGPYEQTKQGA